MIILGEPFSELINEVYAQLFFMCLGDRLNNFWTIFICKLQQVGPQDDDSFIQAGDWAYFVAFFPSQNALSADWVNFKN